jgi:sugar phosphate isomerase/epimerase
MSGTAAIINPLNAFNVPLSTLANPGFELLIFATNWGFSGNWDEFCSKIKAEGYDGMEVWYPGEEQARKEFLAAVEKHNLKFGFLFGGSDTDYQKHLQQFKSTLEQAATLNPVYINSHSGKDHFSSDQNKAFIDFTVSSWRSIPRFVLHLTYRIGVMYMNRFLTTNPKS